MLQAKLWFPSIPAPLWGTLTHPPPAASALNPHERVNQHLRPNAADGAAGCLRARSGRGGFKSRSKHGLFLMSPGLEGVEGWLAGGFLAGRLENSQNLSGQGVASVFMNKRGVVLPLASHVITAAETQQQEGK